MWRQTDNLLRSLIARCVNRLFNRVAFKHLCQNHQNCSIKLTAYALFFGYRQTCKIRICAYIKVTSSPSPKLTAWERCFSSPCCGCRNAGCGQRYFILNVSAAFQSRILAAPLLAPARINAAALPSLPAQAHCF